MLQPQQESNHEELEEQLSSMAATVEQIRLGKRKVRSEDQVIELCR